MTVLIFWTFQIPGILKMTSRTKEMFSGSKSSKGEMEKMFDEMKSSKGEMEKMFGEMKSAKGEWKKMFAEKLY